MAIYTISRENVQSKMNILIYGDPGVGKTYLAGTAQDVPSMRNVHFLNIDGGMMTLAERGDISAEDIRSSAELERVLHDIANRAEDYKDIRTIVIDNITELHTLIIEELTRREYGDRVKRDKGYSIDQVYLEDYGEASKKTMRILRGFRDLPINVIYTAHRKEKENNTTRTITESKPNLTDKVAVAIMGYMDYVWYLYTGDENETVDGNTIRRKHRYLLTQPEQGFSAKTRGLENASALGLVMKDPTMPAIMQRLFG